MTQSKDCSPTPSIQGESERSAKLDLTDDGQQCISLAPTPTNVIELKPQWRHNFMNGAALLSCSKLTGGAAKHGSGNQLMVLCEEFRGLERINRDMSEQDDLKFWGDLLDRQEVLVGRISGLTPRSLQDFQSIARALTGWTPGAAAYEFDDLYGTDAELMSLLLRGLVDVEIK